MKTFRVSFPVVSSGYDTVDIDEKELVGKTDKEIKELIMERLSPPILCHHCSDCIEDVEIDDRALGKDLANVSYWEE